MSRLQLILALFVSLTLLVAHQTNPPNGKTGAPNEGLCTDCHSLNGQTQNGSISLAGIPSTIQPSTAYVLTVTVDNPNGEADLAGFQVTILNSNNQKAGTMSGASANSTITPSGGRDYWEHNPAQAFPGDNMVSWTVTWTSPAGPPNTTITGYAAGNVAKDNNNDSNDLIVTTTSAGTLEGSGDPLIAEIVTFTDVLCSGGNTGSATAGATGGTLPYSYSWSNGGNTATINNLSDGVYTVTVTDLATSTSSASVTISEPSAIVFQSPVIENVSCFGAADGSIQAGASGGVPPYSFSWSNGSNGSSISNLGPGTYGVTVTDDNNCTKATSYSVTQPNELNIELVSLMHETCFGEEDGSITIGATGGTAPLFAEWSNGFIGNSISDLAPDIYSVTVTDNNDCTATATYTINPGGIVNVTLEQIEHVSCNGGNDGLLQVSASGGQAPYTYLWSNGASGESISNLTAGNYLVTATDNNGCEVVKVYTINQPLPILIQINATGQNLCAGDQQVDLTAVPTGSQPPFTALWSNGVVGLVNPDLGAGTYTITVTDAAGCTASTSATVTAPLLLTVTVSTTDETTPGANDGTAEANVAGGTPGYTYLWSNGSTADSIGGLAPGTYTVTVTDANGCGASGSGQVDAFGCMLDVALGPDALICEEESVELIPTVTGATGDVTYLWSIGATTETILVTGGGEYCLTVTDQSGCQDADCIVITEDIFPTITCPVQNESAPGANDGAITCDSISGSILYLWSNGATTSSISGLAPGEYCVTMTNSNGCTDIQCFTVQAGNCNLSGISIINDVVCSGSATGSVSVSIENATFPVSYIWSTGDTTSFIENLMAGFYSVTVTDAAACVWTQTYSVGEPSPLTITIDTIIDIGFTQGAVMITANGGVPPYTYLWTFPDGSQSSQEDLSLLTLQGFYNVVITDNNGCQNGATVLVDDISAVFPTPEYKAINVYPVPTQDILYIDAQQEIKEAIVMSVDGRIQKRFVQPAGNQLPVSDLEAGWYVIRMTDGQSWYIARMVK